MEHKYNLKRQVKDERDYSFKEILNVHPTVKLPKVADLTPLVPTYIFDQGDEGSCTANIGMYVRAMLEAAKTSIVFSRQFQYAMELIMEGNFPNDDGAQMRTIGLVMVKYGSCLETDDPYIAGDIIKPSTKATADALLNKIKSCYSVPNLTGMKQVIALKSQPVMFGIDVYESFESASAAKTGIIPMPKKGEKLLGGHASGGIKYDDTKKLIKFPNSWGSSWGDKGFGYLPYAYFTKYAYDYWVLQN